MRESRRGTVSLWDLLIVLSAGAVFGAALAACKTARTSAVAYFVVVPIALALAIASAAVYWRLRARLVKRIESVSEHRTALAVFVALPALWMPAWMFIAFNVAHLALRLLER
jgi:hypothetical protein